VRGLIKIGLQDGFHFNDFPNQLRISLSWGDAQPLRKIAGIFSLSFLSFFGGAIHNLKIATSVCRLFQQILSRSGEK
jgi:hypothetical protein